MLKKIILSLMVFWFYCFAGVNMSGFVFDIQTQNGVSGVNVSISGTDLSTTTDSNGNFTISDVPVYSTGFQFKASKQGYVTTYTQLGNTATSDATDVSFPIFSIELYNILHTPPGGIAHTSGKADIVGMVSGESKGPVSGVVITARYMDNNSNAGTIGYADQSNMPDSSLSATSESGVFIIYNVDPYKPIKITGSKPGSNFSSCVVIGYPDTITVGGIEESNSFSFSGKVYWDDNPVSGATVSIPGTTTSTTTGSDGSFNISFNLVSYGVLKISKQNYVDSYSTGRADEGPEKKQNGDDENEFWVIPQNVYSVILSELGKTHIQGKGDIIGEVLSVNGMDLAGVKISLYDRNGTKLNPDIFYFDEDGNPVTGLNETTPDGNFLILNLDPGFYFISGEKAGMEFSRNMVIVFSNGITSAPGIVGWPPVPGLQIYKSEEIQPSDIPNNAQNVKMLAFGFHIIKWETDENVVFDSIIVTAKGTGNIASSLSSANLYLDSNNDGIYETLVSTGTISGNKITFAGINKEIDYGLNQKYAVFFSFNGTAAIGQTFGVDILKYSDVYAHSKDSGISITCEVDQAITGSLMTIAQLYPPEKPLNISPANGSTGINPSGYILESSQFEPGQGNTTHRASQWRMWKDGEDYETFTWYDVEDQINLTSVNTPVPLEGNTKYWWQVRHQNGDLIWSDWSDATSFTTSEGGITPPGKPTNLSPENGATEVELPVTLVSGEFQPGSSPSHNASQWQVYRVEDGNQILVFDSKRDTENKTTKTISGLSYNTEYVWRVRHQDIWGAWSQWSDLTSFTTKEGMKGDLNGDSQIDISDVILCLRMAIGLDPVNNLADMNDDGEIDITDVIKILRKAIGLD